MEEEEFERDDMTDIVVVFGMYVNVTSRVE